MTLLFSNKTTLKLWGLVDSGTDRPTGQLRRTKGPLTSVGWGDGDDPKQPPAGGLNSYKARGKKEQEHGWSMEDLTKTVFYDESSCLLFLSPARVIAGQRPEEADKPQCVYLPRKGFCDHPRLVHFLSCVLTDVFLFPRS